MPRKYGDRLDVGVGRTDGRAEGVGGGDQEQPD